MKEEEKKLREEMTKNFKKDLEREIESITNEKEEAIEKVRTEFAMKLS